MIRTFTRLLVTFLFIADVLFAQEGTPLIHAPAQKVIDTYIKELGIRNAATRDSTWLLAIPLLTKKPGRSLQQALEACCHNQLLRFDLQLDDKSLKVIPTPVGNAVLKGSKWVLYFRDEQDEPQPGVLVRINKRTQTWRADEYGMVVLPIPRKGDKLHITGTRFTADTVLLYNGGAIQRVDLLPRVIELKPLEVKLETGFTEVSVGKAPFSASPVTINERLLATADGNKVTDLLSAALPGYLRLSYAVPGGVPTTGFFHAFSSLLGNNGPLFIVEKLGIVDINSINPYDIISLTLVRDGPLCAQYGRRGANGIVLVKLREGVTGKLQVWASATLSVAAQPNLFRRDAVSVADYVSFEDTNWQNGVYTQREAEHLSLTPLIALKARLRDHQITQPYYDAQYRQFMMQDLRREMERRYYNQAIRQQYNVQLSGSLYGVRYHAGLGYSGSRLAEMGNREERGTLYASARYLRQHFSLDSRYSLSLTQERLNPFQLPVQYPYGQLADEQGRPLKVPYYGLEGYFDTLANGQYFGYGLKPMDEWRRANNRQVQQYQSFQQSLRFEPLKKWYVSGQYQWARYVQRQTILHNRENFFVRDLMNHNAKLLGGVLYWDLPYGDIREQWEHQLTVQDARLQAEHTLRKDSLTLSFLVGTEVQLAKSHFQTSRVYAYGSNQEMNADVSKPLDSTEFYLGSYVSSTLTLKERLVLSVSVRNDQSNRFGPQPLLKGLFYSVGSRLLLDKFPQYDTTWPAVSLLASFGESGNDNRRLGTSTTIRDAYFNSNGQPVATIDNPGNLQLMPEKIRIINIGAKVTSRDSSLLLSFDYYWKKSQSLFGYLAVNPTAGTGVVLANSSALRAWGFDFSAEWRYGNKRVQHITTGWLSYARNRVTAQQQPQLPAYAYTLADQYIPLQGYAVNSILAFPMAPLDSKGDPQVYVQGRPAQNYKAVVNSMDPAVLVNMGSAIPVYYGSLTQRMLVGGLVELAVQVNGRFGYVYRRPSYSSQGMIDGTNVHPDFNKRWKAPGDELLTAIPAFRAIPDKDRERLYAGGSSNVQPADHIRLGYIQAGLTLKQTKVYLTLFNPGILWRKNPLHEDPDAVTRPYDTPRSLSISITRHF